MKFTRRAEGIKSARGVFKKAREDGRTKYHVFVAAALMEYYCSKVRNIGEVADSCTAGIFILDIAYFHCDSLNYESQFM